MEGEVLEKWQQDFSSRVHALRDKWSQQFENLANELLEPAFEEFSDFTRRCDMQSSSLENQRNMRSFKFSLCEDAYVMIYFRPKGLDQIECDHECFLPREGKVGCAKEQISATNAERPWVDRCFRAALDELVTRFAEIKTEMRDVELILV